MAARASNATLASGRGGPLQEFGQRCRSSVMHGRTYSHLDGLQIQTPRLAPAMEDDAQQLAYFARDFLVDRFGSFFSCGERVCSIGRARQIFSFTSSNC